MRHPVYQFEIWQELAVTVMGCLCFVANVQAAELKDGDNAVFIESNRTFEITGKNQHLTITGSHNSVTVHGDLASLSIVGGDNKVSLDHVDTINLLGAGNEVSYLAVRAGVTPRIEEVGQNNRTILREAPPGSANVNPAASPGAAKPLVLSLHNGSVRQAVDHDEVVIEGSNNDLTLTGRAGLLTVHGSNNDIQIDRVGRVDFDGSNNHVVYRSGTNGSVPATSNGGNNDLERADE